MDLLYSKYSNPMDLMRLYIDNGRFGEFVSYILDMEYKRRKAEIEEKNDDRLWQMFLHSHPDKCFKDWKEEVMSNAQEQQHSYSMTDQQVDAVNEKSRSILKRFNPKA